MSEPKLNRRLLDDIETIQDLLLDTDGVVSKVLLRGGLTLETRAELEDLVTRIREHPLVVSSNQRVARATQLAGGPA